MRIAIFSDIHGNKYALKEALNKMNEIGIDVHICCGDLVGYYYYHNEVIEALRNIKNIYCVRGNHDQIFIDIFDQKIETSTYKAKYGCSIEKFLNTISKDNLDFLRNLSIEQDILLDGYKIKIVHGSPWNPINDYVYPDSDFERYSEVNVDYILQGHTHYPMLIKQQKCQIINPGSIGQPRDGGYPSFVVFDTTKKQVEFIQFKYNIEKLISDIKCIDGEPDYLLEVLRRPLDDK